MFRSKFALLFVLLSVSSALFISGLPALTISTVAGDGTMGSLGPMGDGGPATSAQLFAPRGLACMGSYLYIADRSAHKVRLVAAGTIYTAAGTVSGGFNGDGMATLSELYSPCQLAPFGSNLYIADSGNNRIRMAGAINLTTVAGTGVAGYAGDGGLATAAQFSYPEGVALDASGNLYVADRDNNCVRRIDASTKIVTTIAGTGLAGNGGASGVATSLQLCSPSAVAVFGSDVYVADTGNHKIRQISGGSMSVVAGGGLTLGDGGPATSAKLFYPYGLAIDSIGRLVIADTFNGRIRRVELDGTINTLAGTGAIGSTGDGGEGTLATLQDAKGVAVDASGNIYIADGQGRRVRMLAAPVPTATPTVTKTVTKTTTMTRTPSPNNTPTITPSPTISRTFTSLPTPTFTPPAGSVTFPLDRLVTDGTVRDITANATTLYVSGDFAHVGIATGEAVGLDPLTGVKQAGWPEVAGQEVHKALPDGAGGWYLGGDFNFVAGQQRTNIAHVLANGSLDPSFKPLLDGGVRDLLLDGNTLYVAGNFGYSNGMAHRALVALNAVDGSNVAGFDPIISSGGTNTLCLVGGTLYVGGFYTFVTGADYRHYMGAFDKSTGAVIPAFDPQVDNAVYCSAYIGGRIYIGGSNAHVNGYSAVRMLSALDPVTGVLDASVNAPLSDYGAIEAMAYDGVHLFVGGWMGYWDGATMEHGLLSLVPTTGAVDPSFNFTGQLRVTAMALNGGDLYVGGPGLLAVADQTETSRVWRLDAASGAPRAGFDAGVLGWVSCVGYSPTSLYVGGSFAFVNRGTTRRGLAAFDLATGALIPAFDAGLNGRVRAVALGASRIYVSGSFDHANSAYVGVHIIALDPATGTLVPSFNSTRVGIADKLFELNGTLYGAGSFGSALGIWETNLLAVDASTGIPRSGFDGGLEQDSVLETLESDGTRLFVGGYFNTVHGITRTALAALDPLTGALDLAWDAGIDGSIFSLLHRHGRLYGGGYFTSVNHGLPRSYLAAFDPATGALVPQFDPDVDDFVYTIRPDGGRLWIGGRFGHVNGSKARQVIAAVSASTGELQMPDLGFSDYNYSGEAVAVALGGALYVGGSFYSVSNRAHPYLVAVILPTATVTPTISQTFTVSPTFTLSPTISATCTPSPTVTPSPTASGTRTATASASPTATMTPTMTRTASPSASASVTPSATRTVTATASPTPTLTATATITPTHSITPTWTETPPRPSAPAGQAFSYPNPAVPGSPLTLVFPASAEASIDIYDWSARKVLSLPASQIFASQGYAVWDGRDAGGSDLASGLYLVRIVRPEGVLRTRLSLLRAVP